MALFEFDFVKVFVMKKLFEEYIVLLAPTTQNFVIDFIYHLHSILMLIYNKDFLVCLAFVKIRVVFLEFVILVLYLESIDLLNKKHQLVLDTLVFLLLYMYYMTLCLYLWSYRILTLLRHIQYILIFRCFRILTFLWHT